MTDDFKLSIQDDSDCATDIVAAGQRYKNVRIELENDSLRVMIGPSVKYERIGDVRRFMRRYNDLRKQYNGRLGVTDDAIRLYVADELGYLDSIKFAF